MERAILAVLSDTHGGHKLGLLNPAVKIHEESPYGDLIERHPVLTSSQEYLFALYQRHIERLKEIARDDPIIVLHNGDPCHGNAFPDELVSTRESDQILIAAENLRCFAEIPNVRSIRLAFSTPAHSFGEGTSDILVSELLQREFPDLNIAVVHHGCADVAGLQVDYAHKGPSTGRREWLKGNEVRYYLRDLMLKELSLDNVPAGLYVRSHVHEPAYEIMTLFHGPVQFVSRIIITPSYCLLGDWAHGATKSEFRIYNGMAVVEIVDGEVHRCHFLMDCLDIRTKEKL